MKWIVNVTEYVVLSHRALGRELIIRGKDKSHGYMQSGVGALHGIVLNLRQSYENAQKTALTALWFSSGKLIAAGQVCYKSYSLPNNKPIFSLDTHHAISPLRVLQPSKKQQIPHLKIIPRVPSAFVLEL